MITADHSIFTSVRTPMGCGYSVIAASPGVTAEERADITRWSPSHGNLCSEDPSAEGLASYLLSTGRRCVAWSRHAGPEPTGRGGLRIHTHAVLLSPEAYRELACMPAAVLPAIEALTGMARSGAAGLAPARQAVASAPGPLMPASSSLEPLTITPAPLTPGAWTQCPFASLQMAAACGLAPQTAVIMAPDSPVAYLTATLAILPAYARERLTLSAGLRYSRGRSTILTWVLAQLTPAESAGLAAPVIDLQAPSACSVRPPSRTLPAPSPKRGDSSQAPSAKRGDPSPALSAPRPGVASCEAGSEGVGVDKLPPWLQLMARWWSEGRHEEILALTAELTGDAGEEALNRVVMLVDDLDGIESASAGELTEITTRYATWQPRTPLETALLTQLRAEAK